MALEVEHHHDGQALGLVFASPDAKRGCEYEDLHGPSTLPQESIAVRLPRPIVSQADTAAVYA